jgi:hypothetical protein
MLLDSLMPEYDATRIEHRVIDGQPADVYEAAVHADFLDAVRRSPIVRGLFALRAAAERGAATIRRSQIATPPELANLRLAELPEHGDWVRLGADPPNEFAFGVIGRFWSGKPPLSRSTPPPSHRSTPLGTRRSPPTSHSAPTGVIEPWSVTRRAPKPPTRPPAERSFATGPSSRPASES